jgi:hypothetical protein
MTAKLGTCSLCAPITESLRAEEVDCWSQPASFDPNPEQLSRRLLESVTNRIYVFSRTITCTRKLYIFSPDNRAWIGHTSSTFCALSKLTLRCFFASQLKDKNLSRNDVIAYIPSLLSICSSSAWQQFCCLSHIHLPEPNHPLTSRKELRLLLNLLPISRILTIPLL